MGIEIATTDEDGKVIASTQDSRNLLHHILPNHEDASYRFLNCVDWYGDTTFNRYQIPVVRVELKRLKESNTADDLQTLLCQIDQLAEQALMEPHLYLKFLGD